LQSCRVAELLTILPVIYFIFVKYSTGWRIHHVLGFVLCQSG